MSDVERPSNGGKPSNSPPPHGLPARNMADIARLFLEGARPLPTRTPPGRRPDTTPPVPHQKERTDAPPPTLPPASTRSSPPTANLNTPENTPSRAIAVLGLACAAHEAANWKLLVQAARGLAEEQSTTVAIVGLLPNGEKHTLVIDVLGVESAEELPAMPPLTTPPPHTPHHSSQSTSAAAPDMQIARALHRLRPVIGLWIIAAPCHDARAFPAVASIVREWLLACPTDNDGLIAGYQFLKQAWMRAGADKDNHIAPTVYLLSEDYAQAAVVHKRLRKAAKEFLGTDLALAGAGPIRRPADHGAGEPIRVLSLSSPGPEDALWAAVLDELCPMAQAEETPAREAPIPTDIEAALEEVENQAAHVADTSVQASTAALDHLAQVLDPEERAALNAQFEEPGVPVATAKPAPAATPPAQHMEVESSPPPVILTKSAIPTPSEIPSPPSIIENRKSKIENSVTLPAALRAFDLESPLDRAAQWQAVERSIWDLAPRSALLDARPPMSWASETCIAIDAAGRVNVWTLYKDGASWFALREWAHEHRNLLALTRRDLVVDKNADVAVHVVLPLEDFTPPRSDAASDQDGVVPTLLRAGAKNLYLYRLRMVEWNGRRGLMVVPLA